MQDMRTEQDGERGTKGRAQTRTEEESSLTNLNNQITSSD
jgi:hypothetical protein